MNGHIFEYYKETSDPSFSGHFHQVIALHENKDLSWEALKEKDLKLSKGWFELSKLSSKDRVDFTMQFWISKFLDHPTLISFLEKFFAEIDDIYIFVLQKKIEDPYETHMIYSLKGDKGFFKGYLPATDDELNQLKTAFPDITFPKDYLSFLQIHNGFSKATDTGIFKSNEMPNAYRQFIKWVTTKDTLLICHEKTVDPAELIPFYESFGQPFFQCFWNAWYPENEMGNVYYSSATNTISYGPNFTPDAENMAFATFSDWLAFYLESLEA